MTAAQTTAHTYIAIDLKSFYASVECREMGYDPLRTNLVVADASRTEKTICLAVSPSLKAHGISGRARLFEVLERLREVNAARRKAAGGRLAGKSVNSEELSGDPRLEVDFITATPRMALYMEYSARIYQIYLRYIAPEDIHVYSIDEVFMDVTHYLGTYQMNGHELARKIIRDILSETGITATAGIGTNLYLCKVAMDIVAKHVPSDADGVRIAELDEFSYRRLLWTHRPLTDFWRVGRGYAKKLEQQGLFTMGDVARCSLGRKDAYYNEDLLFRLFGVNAELLIDHAWGYEPCTMAQIKAYRPSTNSTGAGQVLTEPYPFEKARLIVREMADQLALDLVSRGLVTDQIVLTAGYDIENLTDPVRRRKYTGEITTDYYGRQVPKHAHGTANLGEKTASAKKITEAAVDLFARTANKELLVRRVYITANHIEDAAANEAKAGFQQLDLFADLARDPAEKEREERQRAREKSMQEAVVALKKKFGKNAVLKGMNLEEGATARERNRQIGGHKA